MEVGPHELDRFLVAQHGTHDTALAEIKQGRKLSHWMWWEFPQLRGLGRSHRAVHYGLEDLDEAARFLAHPVLRAHLLDHCRAMLAQADRSATDILGSVDAQKLQSCATLFAALPDAPVEFGQILDRFFDGQGCSLTRDRIGASGA